jgi:hypothetical protein
MFKALKELAYTLNGIMAMIAKIDVQSGFQTRLLQDIKTDLESQKVQYVKTYSKTIPLSNTNHKNTATLNRETLIPFRVELLIPKQAFEPDASNFVDRVSEVERIVDKGFTILRNDIIAKMNEAETR